MDNPLINVEQIEQAIISRDYDNYMKQFSGLMAMFELEGNLEIHVANRGMLNSCDESLRLQLYTRLTTTLIMFIADPKVVMSEQLMEFFSVCHRALFSMIAASGFQNTDAYIIAINKLINNENKESDQNNLAKILVMNLLDNSIQFDFKQFFAMNASLAASFYLGYLSSQVILTSNALINKKNLIDMSNELGNCKIERLNIQLATTSWFLCSYLPHHRKNMLKKNINKLLSSALVNKKFSLINNSKLDKKPHRKKILVCLEQFYKLHAMHRCYMKAIQSLKKEFEVVVVATKGMLDPESRAEFNRVYEISNECTEFEQVTKQLIAEKADAVYYTSLGMGVWSVLLCNMRIAPIQLMTYGHPSSSMSSYMDYGLMEEGYYRKGIELWYSEQLVFLPNRTLPIDPPLTNQDLFVLNKKVSDKNIVKIAIPARSYKICSEFLETLKQICIRSSVPIELNFFPNEVGIRHDHVNVVLQRLFSKCVVHYRTDYKGYIDVLKDCDVVASTFPFTGSNSTYDSLNLGIPVVTYESTAEQLATSDSFILNWVNAPKELITYSKEDYINQILKLIEDKHYYNEVSNKCKGIMKDYTTDCNHDNFCNTVKMLVEKHDKIKHVKKSIFYDKLVKL